MRMRVCSRQLSASAWLLRQTGRAAQQAHANEAAPLLSVQDRQREEGRERGKLEDERLNEGGSRDSGK